MINLAKRFANDESGAAAIEYGLIAAGFPSQLLRSELPRFSVEGDFFEGDITACYRRQMSAVHCRTANESPATRAMITSFRNE
jgi:hypothetical protein